MRKFYKYFLIVIIFFGIINVYSFPSFGKDREVFSEFCDDNGYDGWNIDPILERSSVEFDDKLFVNCHNKIIVDGKLQIINEWVEIDYELSNQAAPLIILVVSGLLIIGFEVYGLNRDDW